MIFILPHAKHVTDSVRFIVKKKRLRRNIKSAQIWSLLQITIGLTKLFSSMVTIPTIHAMEQIRNCLIHYCGNQINRSHIYQKILPDRDIVVTQQHRQPLLHRLGFQHVQIPQRDHQTIHLRATRKTYHPGGHELTKTQIVAITVIATIIQRQKLHQMIGCK